ncbi:MAG TPA: DUF302 domain-containing protein [Nitrospiria bacterium]|nr:DUF302 domain-containing protein [Nitrospiria bacterium]
MKTKPRYGYSKTLNDSYEDALVKVTEELKKEGFGVITEIDVKETLKKKLGVDFKKYKILGACNPSMAYRALSQETELGLFLPCNVIVYENTQGKTVVSAIDPIVALSRIDNPQLEPIAKEISARLQQVIASI